MEQADDVTVDAEGYTVRASQGMSAASKGRQERRKSSNPFESAHRSGAGGGGVSDEEEDGGGSEEELEAMKPVIRVTIRSVDEVSHGLCG